MRKSIHSLLTSAIILTAFASGQPDTSAADPEGFLYATPQRPLQFPEDHGSHPQFKTEWWYITGHLANADRSIDIGFQLTFFRSASRSEQDEIEQIYMAHAAVSDKVDGQFYHEERLNSGDWNADAAVGDLDVYNGNWYLRMVNSTTERMEARFSLAEVGTFQVTFTPKKEKTLFGKNGYSKKGDAPGAASHYITFTRLAVDASLKKKQGSQQALKGLAWMDHEFSSSQLTEDQIGWNWTSLILEDGSELMAYIMRRKDGAVDPNSSLTLIAADGRKTEISSDQFSWEPVRYWTSPDSDARYPVEYDIRWSHDNVSHTIRVRPFMDAQEMVGSIGDFVYWEGASEAVDENGERIGLGYTELTGYSDSLYGKF